MKLWKILLATMAALVLVCAVAMAEETKYCEGSCASFSEWTKKTDATCATGSYWEQYKCAVKTCPNNKVVVNTKYADDKLSHTWDETKTVVVNPTCTEAGSTTKYCTVCKTSYVTAAPAKTGHAKIEVYQRSKDPTCVEAGYTYYQCGNYCGYEWKETIPATGNHNTYTVYAKDATCTAEGYTEHTVCYVCGQIFGKVVLPKVDHYLVERPQLGKDPTCTQAGYAFLQCFYNCGYTMEYPLAAAGHNMVWQEHKAPTCTVEGYTGHDKCTVCGATELKVTVPTVAHTKVYVDSLSKAATCTEDGYKYYQCGYNCGYTWTETVKALGHDYQDEAQKNPTCCEEGYTAHQACTRTGCKATLRKEVIPATGAHTLVEVSVTPSTCLKEGTKIEKCSYINCTYSKTTTLKLADHTWTSVEAQAAVCGSDGWSAHEKCTVEKCTATRGKVVIPAAGAHKWEKDSTVAATCTKGGYEMWKCTKAGCTATEKRNEVAKLGHDVTLLVSTTQPTCNAQGVEVRKCSRCDDTTVYKTTYIAKLDHNYVEAGWSETIAATCTSEGLAERYCTYCGGEKQVKTLAALGHKMCKDKDAIVVKAATCEKDGEAYKVCERCTLRETIVLTALGHKAKDVTLVTASCEYAGMKKVVCEREGCGKLLEKNVIVAAKGHKGKVTKEVAATCTKDGSKTIECTVCNTTATEKVPALGHNYSWITLTPPSAAGNGTDANKCTVCGDIAETKTVKYSKMYYNNTMTSFGPTTKELVGGNDWYRVTPVDLAVDGVYTYDLIASNKYVVGTVTIAVNAGTMTVSYKTKANVEVNDESLLIYASKADLAAGTAVTAPVGAAINATETFGADTKVLVSLILTGNYDAAGKGLVDASAASGMIANID